MREPYLSKSEVRALNKAMHREYLRLKLKAEADAEIRVCLIKFQDEHELDDANLVNFVTKLSESIAVGDDSNVVNLFADLPEPKAEQPEFQRAFQNRKRLSKASVELKLTLIDFQSNYNLTTIELVSLLLDVAHRGSLAVEREMWKGYIDNE